MHNQPVRGPQATYDGQDGVKACAPHSITYKSCVVRVLEISDANYDHFCRLVCFTLHMQYTTGNIFYSLESSDLGPCKGVVHCSTSIFTSVCAPLRQPCLRLAPCRCVRWNAMVQQASDRHTRWPARCHLNKPRGAPPLQLLYREI